MRILCKCFIVLAALMVLGSSLLPGEALAHGRHGGGHGGCDWLRCR